MQELDIRECNCKKVDLYIRNPGAASIELDLLKALSVSGAVSADNSMDPVKIGFSRSARTDKGVHASGQIVTFKMILDDPDIIQKINAALPPQIRVWGYVKTLKNFNAKSHCDSRFYEYLCPTYVLQPADKGIVQEVFYI
jgi:tRNA pseudouridine38-40 synthase